ncbi:MAG: 2-dehydropantoate 2-reductase [Actinomycetia bacterium]|nr:2-dehydropantoate 2-reductase [Actinomycetes bacterium]
MRLVVVGPGSLGQVFAAVLARAGHQVWLVGRADHVAALRQDGIRLVGADPLSLPVTTASEPAAGQIAVADGLGAGTPVDALLFMTKAHQLAAAAEPLRHLEPTAVLGMQNGMAKDDILADAFGTERVLGAVTVIAAARLDDGTVQVTQKGGTWVGPGFAPLTPARQAVAEAVVAALSASGYPAALREDMRAVEWAKAANALAAFGVGIATRASNPEIWATPAWVAAFQLLCREAIAVARAAEGIEVPDLPGFPVHTYAELSPEALFDRFGRKTPPDPAAPRHYASMVQDLLAGRRLEVDAVFGDVIRRARAAGVAVPALEFAWRLAQGFDAHAPGRPS